MNVFTSRLKKAAKCLFAFGGLAVLTSLAMRGYQAQFEPGYAEMSEAAKTAVSGGSLLLAGVFLAAIWFGVGGVFAALLGDLDD